MYSSRSESPVTSESGFSENMSDHVSEDLQNLEISLNPAMRQPAISAVSAATTPVASPLNMSILENIHSQDRWPNSNNLMEIDEEASSDNSTVIPRSSTQAETTAPRSTATDLFGLGAARRDTTRLANSATFSIGENRISTHGKGRKKDLGHQGRRPRSRLSSASSASLGSIPVEVP